MAKIVTNTPDSFESLSFESLAQCISGVHSALQTMAVSAVNRYATIRNWLIGRYIVEYEQCGKDRSQYGAKLLSKLTDRLKMSGINATLLKNARRFYLSYPQISEVANQICPMLSDRFPKLAPYFTLTLNSLPICPTVSDKFITPASSLISNLSFLAYC